MLGANSIGDFLYPEEGTTQGNPLAMPFYALATVPLTWKLSAPVTQVWYADVAAVWGKISALRACWDQVLSLDAYFGYLPNASKTWLVTKQQYIYLYWKKDIFCDTAVKVTTNGRPHLGAPIGTSEYVEKFIVVKIDCWISEVYPYASFTHGLISRWLYVSCTVPDMSSSFHPLEKALITKFIPALTLLLHCSNQFLPFQ